MLLKRLLGEKVELDVRYGRDLWPIKADVNQFEQVVVNLAVNARDAMPEGGKLTLRTSNVSDTQSAAYNLKGLTPADYVLLEVEDSGTGMSPEVMEKIFEPFFTTKEIGKGTGLGLSMVFGIVKQSGGFIFCDSVLGKGTTFRIFLPRHHQTAEEADVARPEEAKAAGQSQDLTGRARSFLSRTRRPSAPSARGRCARAATPCWRPAPASRRWSRWRSMATRSRSSFPTWSCPRWTARRSSTS